VLTREQAVEHLAYVQTAIACVDACDFDGLQEVLDLHALFRHVTETGPDDPAGPDRLAEMRRYVGAARVFARAVDQVRLERIQQEVAP
jgi:hypothetical protein